jgi:hypothetical protein
LTDEKLQLAGELLLGELRRQPMCTRESSRPAAGIEDATTTEDEELARQFLDEELTAEYLDDADTA